MDLVRFGRAVRALRQKRRWRQVDLARRARVSRATISRLEGGAGGRLALATIGRVAEALGARVNLRLDWNGEALDRLLDAEHARLVEQVVHELALVGWVTATEVTFAIAGERGAVDVVAWHPSTSTVIVIEVKSVVPDVQAMLAGLDRKARLAMPIARSQGWSPRAVGRLLVIRETRTSRRRIEAHRETFGSHLPDRNVAVRQWLRAPSAMSLLRGLWFVPDVHGPNTRHRVVAPRRLAERE